MSIGKIAVVGTGANGAIVGSDLIRAGYDVTFIEQWPDHVEAMRKNGITVRGAGGTTVTPVRAMHLCQVAELRETFDLVLVLVKAYDTRWATELIKPRLASDGLLIGIQNGMMARDIASIVGVERTLGAVVGLASNMFDPGIVTRDTPIEKTWFGLGALDGGPQARAAEVAGILRAVGKVDVFDDILSAKWMKLVVNAAELVPAAIVDLPGTVTARLPGMHAFMIAAGVEALRTGIGAGHRTVPLFGLAATADASPEESVRALIDALFGNLTVETTITTVHQDWMKGRHSEVEEINGLVVREAERQGRAAPANKVISEIALEIERGEAKAGQQHLPRLLAALH